MEYFQALLKERVLISHHWPLERQREFVFSHDEFYLTCHPTTLPNTLQLPRGQYDVADVLKRLPKGWEPTLFVAKVDAFFNMVPRNVSVLKCPKVLVLGDTQHGENPLINMINYTKSETYDFHVTDHKRHHLWYYYLAGIQNLYWLPGFMFLKEFDRNKKLDKRINVNLLEDKAVFFGQVGKFHPRRKRLLEYIDEHAKELLIHGQLPQEYTMQAFSVAPISLNISLNGDFNLRALEILSAGGFLLQDKLSKEAGVESLLEPGIDFETYENAEDLLFKIQFYLKNKNLVLRMRMNANEKFTKSLSVASQLKRFSQLLECGRLEPVFTCDSRVYNKIEVVDFYLFLVIYQICQEYHKNIEVLKIYLYGECSDQYRFALKDQARLNLFYTSKDKVNYEGSIRVNSICQISNVSIAIVDYLSDEVFLYFISCSCSLIILRPTNSCYERIMGIKGYAVLERRGALFCLRDNYSDSVA